MLLIIERTGRLRCDQLIEEILHAARDGDGQDPERDLEGIVERVGDIPWQVRDAACNRTQAAISKPDLDLTCQHMHDFIFVAVEVKPISRFGLELGFEEIIGARRLCVGKLMGDSKEA